MKRAVTAVGIVLALVVSLGGPASARNQMPNVTVREGEKYATVWIYPDCPVAMSYRTEDRTAKAPQRDAEGREVGGDYRAVSGHTVRGGAVAFRVPIIDDRVRERTETVGLIVDITTQEVFLFIAGAGCAYGTPTFQTIHATLTILDND